MLDRRIKLAFDVFGLLVTLASISVFYQSQDYAIVLVLALVGIGLLLVAVYLILTPPITYRKLHWFVEIPYADGSLANVRKETTLTANQRNIRSLVDRNLVSEGKLEVFGCNLGDIHGPHDEAGASVVTVFLKTPLPIGKTMTKVLSLRIRDSFTKDKEAVSCGVHERYKEIGLHVALPKKRTARSATAYMFNGDVAEKLPNVSVAENGRNIQIVVDKPRFGAKYVLEWEW